MKFKKTLLITYLVAMGTVPCFAATTVFDAGTQLANDASAWIIGISTAAAVVGVGTGALMKKMSFGDDQKIRTGNKIMSGSIIAWAVLNGLPLILGTIQNYI